MNNKIDKIIQSKNSLDSKMKKIIKIKEMSANEKFSNITKIFSNYCNFQLFNDANLKTFELYYEDFMIDDNTKHEYKYSLCFDSCRKETIYYQYVRLLFNVQKLISQGLDFKKLSATENTFLNNILSIKEKFQLNEDFNFESFYYNEKLADSVSIEIEKLINDLQENFYEKE